MIVSAMMTVGVQVAEKDAEGREVVRRYVLDPKDKDLVTCKRCRQVVLPAAIDVETIGTITCSYVGTIGCNCAAGTSWRRVCWRRLDRFFAACAGIPWRERSKRHREGEEVGRQNLSSKTGKEVAEGKEGGGILLRSPCDHKK